MTKGLLERVPKGLTHGERALWLKEHGYKPVERDFEFTITSGPQDNPKIPKGKYRMKGLDVIDAASKLFREHGITAEQAARYNYRARDLTPEAVTSEA